MLFSRRASPAHTPEAADARVARGQALRTTLTTILAVSLWVGLALNLPTAWRRAETVWHEAPGALHWLGPLSELAMVLGVTTLLLCVASWLGRWALRGVTVGVLLVSALCAYYMTRYNVVIGYGVMQAIFTTDHDMSSEVVGVWMILWLLTLGVLPAVWAWRRLPAAGLWHWLRSPKMLGLQLSGLLVAYALAMGGNATLKQARSQLKRTATDAETNLVGVAAHSYVPSNWLAGAGMVAANRWSASARASKLKSPTQQFKYEAPSALDDAVVVLVIGETTRSDHMGLFGYARDTTPVLRQTPNVAAFHGWSCDTATKLSLACMFVRPEGIVYGDGLAPDTILEDNVFSVYQHLGFGIELFAMQSEAGFYARVKPDFYKLREVIAAQPENAGKRLDDLLLLPELQGALARHPQGQQRRQLVVLHTKGSHFLYTQRYPREFAQWTPECHSADAFCTGDELLNAFDNSVRFVDHTLGQFMAQLKDRKALLIFSSDHGESIAENMHFHATPRKLAPPEQRRVPLVFWASDRWLAEPALRAPFERLQARAQTAATGRSIDDESIGHHNLFASMLGCMGVKSPDGGITAAQNLCE